MKKIVRVRKTPNRLPVTGQAQTPPPAAGTGVVLTELQNASSQSYALLELMLASFEGRHINNLALGVGELVRTSQARLASAMQAANQAILKPAGGVQ